MKKVLIVGAGARGVVYAKCLNEHAEQIEIVGVAEPRPIWRDRMAEEYNIPGENVFEDWSEPLKRDRFADAVVLATPDHLHTEPAIGYAEQGYHILLEKPMAPAAPATKKSDN